LEGFDIMMILLSQLWLKVMPLAFALAEGGDSTAAAFDWSPMGIWRHMGAVARVVLIILLVMSIWSIAIMVERYLTFSAARNQSREFAPKVAGTLKNNKIEEAISLSDKYKKSHLAMVVNAGLQEFRAHQVSTEISGDVLDASKRALQRASAIKIAEFRRGLSGLATIGSTAPFVGLFGTTFGIINAFVGMGETANAGIAAIAAGIAEALVTTAVGLAVAVPAVWLFNYFTSKVDNFVVEMDNSSAELIDFFVKQRSKK
jgi:biopolymer transport protein ExbB/biopolymer transport protein TolQ